MRYTVCFVFGILGLLNIALADDLTYFSITPDQAADIKQKLASFENGKLTIQALNESNGAEGCRELIGYYLQHSNEVTVKAKLPIARSYAGFNMFSNAIELGTEYVNVYSNDWHGWRLLGGAYDYADANYSNESIHAYSNAVKLGDKDSYEPYAGVALKNNMLQVVRDMIPQLLALKGDKKTPETKKLNLTSLLLIYSMKADRKDIFLKALEGVSMQEILSRENLTLDVKSGCGFFEDEDTNMDIEKIRQSLEAATKNR